MKYLIRYKVFENENPGTPVDPINPYKGKTKEQIENAYLVELGRRGELSKYLREHGNSFTFGLLKAVYDDALVFKRKREFKKAGLKFFHRIIPMAASFIFLPISIISSALGASRAFDKMLYPILNDPGNNYSDFTKKIITKSIQLLEGDYRMFLKNDWFYNIFKVDQGLIDLVKKEHMVAFASYLAKKMNDEDPNKEVPVKYVQTELKNWIETNFGIKVDFPAATKREF